MQAAQIIENLKEHKRKQHDMEQLLAALSLGPEDTDDAEESNTHEQEPGGRTMITESDVSPNPSTQRQHASPKKNKSGKKLKATGEEEKRGSSKDVRGAHNDPAVADRNAPKGHVGSITGKF